MKSTASTPENGVVRSAAAVSNASNGPETALVLYRPLVEKIIAALGALVTHQLAYLVTSVLGLQATSPSDHGHLSTQWAIVAPLAVGAAAGFVVWQLKALGFRAAVSIRQLSVFVAIFFLAQEAIEGLLEGLSLAQLLGNPALLAGLTIAPAVAWLLNRVLTGVTELAARLLAPASVLATAVRVIIAPVEIRFSTVRAGSPSRPRAPPFQLRN
ncbi:MAG: hypothetical protein ACR2QO_08400 [Acidimicrobiales bacterium]